MFCVERANLHGLVVDLVSTGQIADACIAPERPYLPARPEDVRAYTDLLQADFEAYIANIKEYFRCLDAERQRAFLEAQKVSRDYGRLIEILE